MQELQATENRKTLLKSICSIRDAEKTIPVVAQQRKQHGEI